MNYGTTNPRPYADIIKHPWWNRNNKTQAYLTNALTRTFSKTGTVSTNVSTKGFIQQLRYYFRGDDKKGQKCQRATNNGVQNCYDTHSSRDIFEDPTILPYYLSSKEIQGLSSREKQQWDKVRREYVGAGTGRKPTLYRITDFTFCDDLGRIYNRDTNDPSGRARLIYAQYDLTKGSNFRNQTWISTYNGYVKLSAYIAVGYAGYEPTIQQRLYSSLKFDIHHVEENLFSVKPSTLLPLPTWMHLRWVHAADHKLVQNTLFEHKPQHRLW